MKSRTEAEIQAEITALRKCKAYAPRMSAFNDNNHTNIDLQIEELHCGIDDTADEWEAFTESQQSAILEARDWRNGDSDESPSSGWDNYKPKETP